MLGLVFLFVAFALLIGWVGRTAQGRGRNALLWGGIAALAGLAGFFAGFAVISAALDLDSKDGSLTSTLLVGLMPAVLMIAPTAGVGFALQRGGFAKNRKTKWAVHVMQHGEGTLRIDGKQIFLEWPDGDARSMSRHEVQHVEADGECVRVRVRSDASTDEQHYALLPVAKDLTPAARRDLSKQIAMRLVAR